MKINQSIYLSIYLSPMGHMKGLSWFWLILGIVGRI